ncbi:hypothetical protein ACWF94_19320 [Streptomyces sp. NPDC055078]
MAFPDAQVELQIGSTWTPISHVRHAAGISHTRGRRSRGARTEAADIGLTLESPLGLYDNRNPRSPYFGLLGRNTPLRLSVDGGAGALHVPGAATTVDHASLDITGDLDIRLDASLDNWLAGGSVELCGKGTIAGNQRSWLLLARNRRLHFEWSTAGTSAIERDSTVDLPVPPSGRLAVRVTLDVNNGASGHTVTFYTARTISGPWTQLGAPVVTAGVTSVFASTAPVRVGDGWADLGFPGAVGRIHTMEIRNGINGTLVAAPNFTGLAPGTTNWTDSAGRPWTLAGGATISRRRVRCLTEVPEWTPRWHTSGHNVTVPVQGAGLLRRLETGRGALQSTLRRRIPSEPSVVAYWPMEDEAASNQAYSPIAGVPPLRTTGLQYGAESSLPGSAALPRMVGGGSITMDAQIPPYAPTGAWMVTYVYRMDELPATATEILEFRTTGPLRKLTVNLSAGGGAIELHGYNSLGAEVAFLNAATTAFYGTWNRLEVIANQIGPNVEYHLGWIDVSGIGYGVEVLVAGTSGIVTRTTTRCGASAAGIVVGHVGIFSSSNTLIYDRADDGFLGESAGDRLMRLGGEEQVPVAVYGGGSMQMGPQGPEKLLSLLEECEDSDGGILFEQRDRLALGYRTRASLYNQTPALVIDYAQLTHPFEPVVEDAARNDITVSREGGSSARATLKQGPMSVLPHPDGIGPYEEAVTRSLHTDGPLADIAGWLVSLSTWDEYRYPRVRLLLHKHPQLVAQVLDLMEGDVVRITGLPDHLPPGPLDLMVEGFEDHFGEFEWTLDLVCVPAGPWTVGVVEDPILGRADTDGSELSTGVSASATSWSVAVTAGPLWITSAAFPAMFPFSVTCGGEEVTVTAISGASSPQTFTVVRAVNGISKTHSAGASLSLTHPMRAAL